MKRMASKKSHSWWWDSHISPKNSRWLAENLEKMDYCVKEMMKLIEEEGDSFAKKAELYYKRRPELISHVENFYRMYRALAERYDHVSGELRKSIPLGLQSQGSAASSDFGSDPPSPSQSPPREPIPDHNLSRSKSKARAAGFDFFLGSGGASGSRKGSDDSSSSESDSESDSDDAKEVNSDVDPDHLCPRTLHLERELRDVKEKLQRQEQRSGGGGPSRSMEGEDNLGHLSRVTELEAELTAAKGKLQDAQEVIEQLRQDIEKLNDMMASSAKELSEEKPRPETQILGLPESHASLKMKLNVPEDERRQLKAEKTEVCASTVERIEELNQNLDALKLNFSTLSSQKAELSTKVCALAEAVKCRDDQIQDMDAHLQQLQLEHVKLITEAESASRGSRAMNDRIKNLEEEVERQQAVISDGAEKKREAIRQLCFSLQHYRDGYNQLLKALMDHRRHPTVIVSRV